MAFVLLPCDLPTWPTIQRHLRSLIGTTSPNQVTQVLFTLHSLCNVSLDPETPEVLPQDLFNGVERFLETEAGEDFFSTILPFMIDSALNLKNLLPVEGLIYSIQQEDDDRLLERPLVASLLSHIFFCTLPRRTPLSHPTLTDPRFAPVLCSLHRGSQRVKTKALLHYFRVLALQNTYGKIKISRKVMTAHMFLPMGSWSNCEVELCPILIKKESGLQLHSTPSLLTCFTSPDLARPALSTSNSQQVCTMSTYPELLVAAVVAERLEDNEALQISGVLKTASVSNLSNKPNFIPHTNVSHNSMVHVLMDADDYRESSILQYEKINLLRELNKAWVGFDQPPIPDQFFDQQSNYSGISEDIMSISRQASMEKERNRFTAKVSSDIEDENIHHEGEENTEEPCLNKEKKERLISLKKESSQTESEKDLPFQKHSSNSIGCDNEVGETNQNSNTNPTEENVKEISNIQNIQSETTKGPISKPIIPKKGGFASLVSNIKISDKKDNKEEKNKPPPIVVDAKTHEYEKNEAQCSGMNSDTESCNPEHCNTLSEIEYSPTESNYSTNFGYESNKENFVKHPYPGSNSVSISTSNCISSVDEQNILDQTMDESTDESSENEESASESPDEKDNNVPNILLENQDSNCKSEMKTSPFAVEEVNQIPSLLSVKKLPFIDKSSETDKSFVLSDNKFENVCIPQHFEVPNSNLNSVYKENTEVFENYVTNDMSPKTLNQSKSQQDQFDPLFQAQNQVDGPSIISSVKSDLTEIKDHLTNNPKPSKSQNQIRNNTLENPSSLTQAQEEDETTRLLNRILKAIEKLEAERPELVNRRSSTTEQNYLTETKSICPKCEANEKDQMCRQNSNSKMDHNKNIENDSRNSIEKNEDNEKKDKNGKPPLPINRKSSVNNKQENCTCDTTNIQPKIPERLNSSTSLEKRQLSIHRVLSEQLSEDGDEMYFSACESMDGEGKSPLSRNNSCRRKSINVVEKKRRKSFADRLKETLAHGDSLDESNSNPEASEDKSKSSQEQKKTIIVHRALMLADESSEDQRHHSRDSRDVLKRESESTDLDYEKNSASSRYSFSSDYSSDMDDVYDQLEDILEDLEGKTQNPRSTAVAKFSHRVLKRALSDTYKGLSLGLDGSIKKRESSIEKMSTVRLCKEKSKKKIGVKHRPPMAPRSHTFTGISLKKRNKSVSFEKFDKNQSSYEKVPKDNDDVMVDSLMKPVVTGNWGCGSLKGDPQLKAMIQWAAASRAGAPQVIYYTSGDVSQAKLDILCQTLLDHHWTVGKLVSSLMVHCQGRLQEWQENEAKKVVDAALPESYRYRIPSLDGFTLFDELFGNVSRASAIMRTEL